MKTSENTVSSTSEGREGTGGRGDGVVVKNEVRREERWAAKSVPAPAISATESLGTGPGVSEDKTTSFCNLKLICRHISEFRYQLTCSTKAVFMTYVRPIINWIFLPWSNGKNVPGLELRLFGLTKG